jgi:hypothetical protein
MLGVSRFRKFAVLVFLLGVACHLIFWACIITLYGNSNSWGCGELSCWILVYADFPVSLLYVIETASTVTLFSAVIGSIWYGLLFWFVGLIVRFVISCFSGSEGGPL